MNQKKMRKLERRHRRRRFAQGIGALAGTLTSFAILGLVFGDDMKKEAEKIAEEAKEKIPDNVKSLASEVKTRVPEEANKLVEKAKEIIPDDVKSMALEIKTRAPEEAKKLVEKAKGMVPGAETDESCEEPEQECGTEKCEEPEQEQETEN